MVMHSRFDGISFKKVSLFFALVVIDFNAESGPLGSIGSIDSSLDSA